MDLRPTETALLNRLVDQLGAGDPFYEPLEPMVAGEGGYFLPTLKMTVGSYHHEGTHSTTPANGGYTILTAEQPIGAIHRVEGVEAFCFLGGDPVDMLHIDGATGEAQERRLSGIGGGGQPAATVEPGVYQATRRVPGPHGYSLYWAVLVPGFDKVDTKVPSRAELTKRFPHLEALIVRYTRPESLNPTAGPVKGKG